MTGGFGANGLAGVNGSFLAGLVTEIVLTFIFVLTILGVTSKKAGHGSFGGLVIGLTLTFVHILGIGLTGTSVNPARSIAPAVFAAFSGNTAPPLPPSGSSSRALSPAAHWQLLFIIILKRINKNICRIILN